MQQEVINEIYREWGRLRERNPAISLRAFSKRIDVPHSALSEILNGKRRLSKKMALRIIKRLNLTEERYQDLMEKCDSDNEFELIDLHSFKILSHWEHFAVLNLLKLKDFVFDLCWMAKRLGISRGRVEKALERLISAGFLKRKQDGSIERVNNNLRTPTEIESQALRNYTRESLEQGIQSLDDVEIEERDFSTVTLTMNKRDIKKAKKLIEEFRYKFDKEIERVPGDEVYKLVIAFYPMTKEVGDE